MLGFYNKTYLAIVNGEQFDKRCVKVIIDENESETIEKMYNTWDDFFNEIYQYFWVSFYKIKFGKDIVMRSSYFLNKKIKRSKFKFAKIITTYEKIASNHFSMNDILKYNDSEKAVAYLKQELGDLSKEVICNEHRNV